MESMHSMSEILFNQVEQIADVKTCNVDNVEQKYYKVQWKCTWEPATVLERFCGKIIADYNKVPETVEKTKPRDVTAVAVNTEIEKVDSQITSNLVIKDPFSMCSTNNDVLNENLLLNKHSSKNNLTQKKFDKVNYNLVLNNFSIKSDPDQEVFPNIDILSESNPTTFNHGEEANNTSDDQNKFDSVNNLTFNNFSIKPDSDQKVFSNINILCESNPTTFNHGEESNTTNKEQTKGLLAYSANNTTESRNEISRNTFKYFIAKNNRRRNRANKLPIKCVKCQLCSYSSPHDSKIKRHMLTHTGEKPFKCQLCTYSASQKTHIKSHMLVHTGKKLLKCSMCSFSTSLKGNLKTHMVTHMS